MFHLVLQALYLMLPAYIANMAPAFFSHLKMGRILDSPIDIGRKYKGVRIFGDHKTVKGFLFGTFFGVLMCLGQFWIFNGGWLMDLSVVNYTYYGAVAIGGLMGFGALVGDSVESFFKRRIGIKPGGCWPVFDQIDFVLGAVVFASIVIEFPLDILIAILVVSPILPVIANIIGYFLGIKKVWW